ncbi:MAG: ACP phosphodiesterase [Acidobacteriota bacterium]
MNYLAHLFLGGDTAESLIGNLAGDFVKGPLRGELSLGIERGIVEHRAIDAFTDTHAEVNAFRKVLVPEFGHYARVISDVFFDHFLAADFADISGEPLESFVDRTCAIIDAYDGVLPGRLAAAYPRMRDEHWLLSYREPAGIFQALYYLSFRLSRRPHMELATRYLIDSRDELEHHFRRFFPKVREFASRLR